MSTSGGVATSTRRYFVLNNSVINKRGSTTGLKTPLRRPISVIPSSRSGLVAPAPTTSLRLFAPSSSTRVYPNRNYHHTAEMFAMQKRQRTVASMGQRSDLQPSSLTNDYCQKEEAVPMMVLFLVIFYKIVNRKFIRPVE